MPTAPVTEVAERGAALPRAAPPAWPERADGEDYPGGFEKRWGEPQQADWYAGSKNVCLSWAGGVTFGRVFVHPFDDRNPP
jgi:hypothetical protein